MSKQKIAVNSNRVAIHPEIHDSAIVQVYTWGEGENISCDIRCRSEAGALFAFKLRGVRLLLNSFYGRQNIVSDCYYVTGEDARDLLIEIKDIERYTFDTFENLNVEIKAGALCFFRLVPSVGADVFCVCKSAELET